MYGSNKKVPYSTDDKVDNPVSLYAATKKSNELMAHAYSKLYNIPSTGLRFFTVYGPAGRPDMEMCIRDSLSGDRFQYWRTGEPPRYGRVCASPAWGVAQNHGSPDVYKRQPLPLLRFAVSATGGAHLCSIQYYLRFWLSSCRTSLAISALRIMRCCLR